MSAFGASRLRLNVGYAEGVARLNSTLLGNWQCGSTDGRGGLLLCDVQRQLMWTLFNRCHVTSCRYADSVTFSDSQGFSVALCTCFPEVIGLSIFLNCFSREWNPFQPLHVDFPAAPKYIYLWVAKWHYWSFLPFVHLRFLYIVFAARPVELIHWI